METFDLQMAHVAFALYVLLLGVAAATDIRGFKIPNWVSAALLLLFIPGMHPGASRWTAWTRTRRKEMPGPPGKRRFA